MTRCSICVAFALLVGCHCNEYANKETGTPDTAGKDIPTQRMAAPEGQMTEATNDAETQRDSNGQSRQ